MGSIVSVAELLTFNEAKRLIVYDDATGRPLRRGTMLKGNPTIGVGRNLIGKGISDDESSAFLAADISECTADLGVILGDAFKNATPARQAAIIDARFALGVEGFREFHYTIACIAVGDWEGAATALVNSHWGGDEKVRVARDAAMLRTGEWPQVPG